MRFLFADCILDADRRELRRGSEAIAVEPQVFDVLTYLIQNRSRVVSKDDLFASIWEGRIVSNSTLTSRINGARRVIGDSGEEQKLIRTVARKGFRFVGGVRLEPVDTELRRILTIYRRKRPASKSDKRCRCPTARQSPCFPSAI